MFFFIFLKIVRHGLTWFLLWTLQLKYEFNSGNNYYKIQSCFNPASLTTTNLSIHQNNNHALFRQYHTLTSYGKAYTSMAYSIKHHSFDKVYVQRTYFICESLFKQLDKSQSEPQQF